MQRAGVVVETLEPDAVAGLSEPAVRVEPDPAPVVIAVGPQAARRPEVPAIAAIPSLQGLRRGLALPEAPTAWRLDAFAGRFGEISGSHAGASLTLAFRLVLEAQRRGEPVAWIAVDRGIFFPPDVAEIGIDLAALVVVQAGAMPPAARAADHLIRSGGFGLVLLDCGAAARLPLNAQTRLVGLAQKHATAFVCLTQKEDRLPSLGSLVSLRAQTVRGVLEGERFRCEARAIKDKRRGPGWSFAEVFHGPDGVC